MHVKTQSSDVCGKPGHVKKSIHLNKVKENEVIWPNLMKTFFTKKKKKKKKVA